MFYVLDEFQVELEVERLNIFKTSSMKELVVKRRMELEEICICAHIEPDVSTMEEKFIAMMDSSQ
jgi:protein regulator of cytokinesis 1